MSAKKRGPGRPPKSKNKKPTPTAAVHTVPKHFWSQVGAILLAVITAILVAGLFGMGGELPVKFAEAVRWLVGWTAFVIPAVFAIQIVQVFRQPDARIPAVIWISTIVFLALFSGTFQLTLSDPTSLLLAQTGNGGGTIGWAVADAALGFVNVPIAALIFVTLMLVLLMFIFSVSPGAVVQAIHDFFSHEVATEENSQKVAEALVAGDNKIKIGGLGRGEIIDNDKSSQLDTIESNDKKRKRKLLSRRRDEDDALADLDDNADDLAKNNSTKTSQQDIEVNAISKIKKAEPAMVVNNSNWQFPSIDDLSNAHRKEDPGCARSTLARE